MTIALEEHRPSTASRAATAAGQAIVVEELSKSYVDGVKALAGATFAELCDLLCDWHEPGQVPMRAAGMLKTWLAEGLVIASRDP